MVVKYKLVGFFNAAYVFSITLNTKIQSFYLLYVRFLNILKTSNSFMRYKVNIKPIVIFL